MSLHVTSFKAPGMSYTEFSRNLFFHHYAKYCHTLIHSEKTNRNYSKSLSKQYPSCHGDHDPLQRRLVIIRNNARNHALNASPPYSNPKYVYCCALRSQKYQHDPKPHLAAKITKITITCATGNLHSKRISS